MKKIYLILVMVYGLMAVSTKAQVSSYTFSQSNGTYTPITGGTVIASGSALDGQGYAVTLPSPFTYNGVAVTQVTAKVDGYLALGVASFSSTQPIASATAATGIIAALACDLQDSKEAGAVPEMSWLQVGNEIVFQWKDFRRYTSTAGINERVSFQIRLNTVTSAINVVYDASTNVAATSTYIPQVGLRGSANTDYNARRLTTTVPTATPDWTNTAAATSNAHNCRYTSTAPAAVPPAGLTFTWTAPACLGATGITASSNSTSSASVLWTGTGTFILEYGAPGFTPGTGATAGVGGTVINPATSPQIISGLTAATTYQVYIRKDCTGSAGGYSANSTAVSFTTACNAISSFPFTENFNGVTTPALPACFSQNNANADADQWISYTTYGVGGSQCAGLYTDFNAGANNDYLILPQFTLTGNQQLKFSVRARSSAEPNDYKVVISTTDNNPASFTTDLLALQTVSSTTMTEITPINLSAYTGNVWIAIQVPAGGLDGYYLYVDDIIVEAIPSCTVPTGLTNGAVTTNSAAFSWTAPSTAPGSGYDYYVSTSNTAPTAGTTPTGSTSPGVTNAVAGGLTANSQYYYWVRSNCGAGDLSSWTGPGSFFTGYCVPAATSTATYINNFSTTGGSANISNLASGFTTGGYQDNYATIGAAITAGSNLNFTLDYVGGTLGAAIWVDFNNNLIFETSERLYNTTSYTATATGTISTALAIPVTTLAGDYRMRVLVDYNASNPTNSCGFGSGRGEVEDYKLTVAAQPTDAMDWVNLQFPATATIAGGGSATVYTKGYEAGVTDPAGAGAGIIVWIGISPIGAPASSDPATWTNWVPATFNVQSGNDDEFQAAIGSSLAVGTYQYASRWQLNGGPYRYGGYNTNGGGFWDGINNVSGVLTVTPPANDDCSGAIVIPCDGSVSGSTTGGTDDVLPGITCGSTTATTGITRAVWFTVTPVNSGPMTISVCTGTTWDTYLRVYTGVCGVFTACAGFDDDGCAESTYGLSSLTFTAVGGTTYYVMLGGFGATGYGAYTISATCPAACAAPTIPTMSAITSTTATATWAGTGSFILEYGPTGYTPGTAGTAGATGTLIDPAVSPQAITGLTPSTTYDLYVRQACAGPTWSPNTPVRTFTTSAPPPANDECAGAITIGSTITSGNISSGTMSLPVGACSGSGSSSDVWFQFTALSDGNAVVNVSGVAGFDAVVEAFGGTCGTLSAIDCEDATGTGGAETLPLNGLIAGNTYFVRVYNYFSTVGAGTFNITVTGAALPITIEYFKGSKQNNGHLLDWKVTCYNSPSVTMLLERSADGRKFTSINNQTETSLRCLQPFSFTDAAPLAGINYYRLKSVDIDGKETYSKIVALLNKDKGFEIVSLVPNPVKDEAVLSVSSATKSIIEIVVSDLSGKQLNKQRVTMIAGNNLLPINVRNLPAGTYQVTGITADGMTRTVRFVKQ